MPELNQKEILLVLASILDREYSDIFFADNITLTKSQLNAFITSLKRLANGEPLAKIIGYKEFYGIKFITDRNTLDPRPETELIVDLFQKYFLNKEIQLDVLDLGCGTGCIGLTLLVIYNNITMVLADVEKKALELAAQNSKKLGVYDGCRFIKSNWFSNVSGKFDVIVSNPPYVEDSFVLDEATSFDPMISLYAEQDGLGAYRQILPIASQFLKEGGKLILEIGINQKNEVLKLARNLEVLRISKDLAGIERTIVFRKL